jgi:GMP reductase
MKIEYDVKLDFNNVLIRPKRSSILSRNDVILERECVFPNSPKKWKGVPIIAANMDTIGTFEVYNVLSRFKMITCFHKFYTKGDFMEFNAVNPLDKNYYMISTGISDYDFSRLEQIMEVLDSDFICIDIANGYLESLITFCQRVRERYPDKILVAGNVVSREIVEELIINGKVDIVKCGIGGGSACITRMKTGVGLPQLSCIIECADAAHGVNGYIIGDGGITSPADMAKAFGGGADFVMCGGVFSGHDENPGEIIEENGQKYKMFYGMSSELAMNKYYGKMAEYRSSEGRILKVKYRGKIENTVLDYLGGLRSCCTYINAKHIKNIPKCTTFMLVSQQLNTSLIS